MVGAFYQPMEVLIDTMFLSTLPEREWKCGIGEIVKYAAIDRVTFDWLNNSKNGITKELAVSLIENSVRYKAGVCERDERESGERKCLNVGHTTGHAIELAYGLSHGESVLYGMKLETELAARMGVCKREYADRLLCLVDQALALQPISAPDFSTIGLAAQKAALDKKNTDAKNVVMSVAKDYGEWTLLSMPIDRYVNAIEDIAKNF